MSVERLSVPVMGLEAEIKAVVSKTASLCPHRSGPEADIKQKGQQMIIIVIVQCGKSREHARDTQWEHLLRWAGGQGEGSLSWG